MKLILFLICSKIEDGFTWVVTRLYKLNDDVGKVEIG